MLTSSLQRPPAITVFPDMLYEDEPVDDQPRVLPSSLTGPPTTVNPSHDQNVPNTVILHSVNVESSSNSLISIFRLNKLPDGLMDRILSPSDNTSTASIKYGLTARTVRWNSSNEVYIFNGRVGSPIYQTVSRNAQILATSKFTAITDQRPFHGTAAEDVDSPVRLWKFKDGEDTDTNRFLQWMGQIEEVDPEAKPDEPDDGAGFRACSGLPQPPQGRPRVPKTTAVDDTDDESNDTDDESQASAPTDSGNASLQPGNGSTSVSNIYNIFGLSASDQPTATNNMTSSSARTIVGRTDQAPTICSPPPFSVNSSTAVSATPFGEPEIYPSSLAAAGNGGAFNRHSTNRSSSGYNGSSTEGSGIPTYDRNYAKVDKIGLRGHAANTATWEHENVTPKKKTKNRSGITRRQMLTSTDSSDPLQVSHTSSLAASSDSLIPPSASLRYSDTRSSPQKWEKVMAHPQPMGEQLIDVASSVQANHTVSEPPGLQQYERKRIPFRSRDQQPNSTQAITATKYGQQRTADLVAYTDNLNGVSDAVSMPPQPGAHPTILQKLAEFGCTVPPHPYPSHQQQQGPPVSAGPHNMDARRTANDDDRIVERLQIMPDHTKLKRDTMRQKAPKKSKKPYKKPAPVKAVLEKPDPIPPPQSKKNKKEATASHSAAHPPQRMQASNQSLTSSSDKVKETTAPSSPPVTAIEELLSSTISSNGLEGAVLKASFGMILMRHTEPRDFLKAAISKDKLQTKLRAAGDSLSTSFFPRLTTSASDALFLLDMIPGSSLSAKMEYEVVVKNAEGSIRVIKINQADRSGVQVVCPDTSLGTTYIHYPLRIWDAKVTIEASRFDTSMADIATKLASSMQTVDEAPSFLAMLPAGVDKVYAKRTFCKEVPGGIELRVVEVQELQLMPIESERYNAQVTAHSAVRMVNEQRLWWECELRAQDVDIGSAATLQALVDEMVTKMDDVGYGNTGPWTKDQMETGAESVAAPEVPFW